METAKIRKIDKVQTESGSPRASTRYTLAKSVFSPRKPRGTISMEAIRVHEGEAATAGGHECVSTLSNPQWGVSNPIPRDPERTSRFL